LQAHFGAANVAEIVKRVYAGQLDRLAVGAASRIVLETAAVGDAVAGSMVERGASALVTLVESVGRTLQWQGEMPVAPAGGMWNSKLFYQTFVSRLRQVDQRMAVRSAAFPPNVGAFLLALHAAQAHLSLETVRVSWEALSRAHS
jgi:N-acetylglucosamine kinase-like BadF-type ATPase